MGNCCTKYKHSHQTEQDRAPDNEGLHEQSEVGNINPAFAVEHHGARNPIDGELNIDVGVSDEIKDDDETRNGRKMQSQQVTLRKKEEDDQSTNTLSDEPSTRTTESLERMSDIRSEGPTSKTNSSAESNGELTSGYGTTDIGTGCFESSGEMSSGYGTTDIGTGGFESSGEMSSGYGTIITYSGEFNRGVPDNKQIFLQSVKEKLLKSVCPSGSSETDSGIVRRSSKLTGEKRTLIENYSYLRNSIAAVELCDHLEQNLLITESDRQNIFQLGSMSDKADLLLQTLLQKVVFGVDEYNIFLKILTETKNTHIVDELKRQCQESKDEPIDGTLQETDVNEYLHIEENLDSLADEIDTLPVAIQCLERGAISVEDYASIFCLRAVRVDSARCFLKCILKSLPDSAAAFTHALRESNCQSALTLIKEHRHACIPSEKICKGPNVKLTCTKNDIKLNVGINYLTDGVKIIVTIDLDNKQAEVEIVNALEADTTRTRCAFAQTAHAECINVESGSVIIHLKTYNDKCIRQLIDGDYHMITELLIQSGVADRLPCGYVHVTIDISRDQTEQVETKIDFPRRFFIRKTMVCNELSPNTYFDVLLDKETSEKLHTKCLTRVAKMEAFMDIILKDETMCARFIEEVRKKEDTIFYERLIWLGTKDGLTEGILSNYKYLIDELIPSNILQYMDTKERGQDEIESLQTTLKRARRACVINLLHYVLNGGESVIGVFYDALCSTGHFEAADRIRRAAKAHEIEQQKGKDERTINATKQEMPSRIFDGEFSIQIIQDTNKDSECSSAASMRLRKSSSDPQLRRFYTVRKEAILAIDYDAVSQVKEDTFSIPWETSLYSLDVCVNDTRLFQITPLIKSDTATVEVIISNDFLALNNTIVRKQDFSSSQSFSIQITNKHECIMESTFGANDTIENVNHVELTLRGCNLRVVESRKDSKSKPGTYRRVGHMKRKVRPATYSGKGRLGQEDDDINDEGYPDSTLSSRTSSTRQIEFRQQRRFKDPTASPHSDSSLETADEYV